MKFEIDDKTKMVKVILPISGSEDLALLQEEGCLPSSSSVLEQILQAVKKTHEKLVNRQIQKIQDSKDDERFTLKENPGQIMYYTGRLESIENFIINGKTYNLKKISQNQKIVDELLKQWKSAHYEEGAHIENMLGNIFNKATGKDIKDL